MRTHSLSKINLDTTQSDEYDMISEAKATDNLDEVEVEGEDSTQMLRKQLFLAKKRVIFIFIILFWTPMGEYMYGHTLYIDNIPYQFEKYSDF